MASTEQLQADRVGQQAVAVRLVVRAGTPVPVIGGWESRHRGDDARCGMCGGRLVGRLLAEQPRRVAERGGPLRWRPLYYLVYSRFDLAVPAERVLAVARQLLDAGADPNEGYLFDALPSRFTLLTGRTRLRRQRLRARRRAGRTGLAGRAAPQRRRRQRRAHPPAAGPGRRPQPQRRALQRDPTGLGPPPPPAVDRRTARTRHRTRAVLASSGPPSAIVSGRRRPATRWR